MANCNDLCLSKLRIVSAQTKAGRGLKSAVFQLKQNVVQTLVTLSRVSQVREWWKGVSNGDARVSQAL